MRFMLVACFGVDECGNDDFDIQYFPTLSQAMRALVEWSNATSDIVVRMQQPDGSWRCVAEFCRSRSTGEEWIEFRFWPIRSRRFSPLVKTCRFDWLASRFAARPMPV